MAKMTDASLHLLPIAGDIDFNHLDLEEAVKLVAMANVDWIITPES